MANPSRLLVHYLLAESIKERVTHLKYICDDGDGMLHATNATETFEVVPPPVSVVPGLVAELASLAGVENAVTSGTFQLVNATFPSIGSWNCDRPVWVDVKLSADGFDLELTYSESPDAPVEVGLEDPPT
ncbi:hypothetical protein RISK_001474 [Rhodopirellula islandica]|uniref:Uncharacterized protein n=2 Tax=Rhodopirellula islandica TaxID=595434 RepID=A0A0J1BII0_RHOIS|nr:hypothetical protein RISK_001474 [Rhodopirellula islandica]